MGDLKKYVCLSGLMLLLLIGGIFVNPSNGIKTFASSQAIGYWKLMDQRSEFVPHQGSPYQVLKKGEVPLFQIQIVDEEKKAHIDWFIPGPPSVLVPTTHWTCYIKGQISQWDVSSLLYSSVNIKFQPINADCCQEGSFNVAQCNLSPGSGDRIKEEKNATQAIPVPLFGSYGSDTTSKFQIRFNVVQAGGSFEWIYAYQWVSDKPSIQVQLQINQLAVKVNGMLKFLDSPPYIRSGRTYIPFRFIGEAFGAKVDFTTEASTGKTKEVSYELNQDRIVFDLLTQRMYKNGQLIQDAPPIEMRHNRVMVPLRILSENLGAQVEWAASTQEVKVSKSW
jgi:hypothetical protein